MHKKVRRDYWRFPTIYESLQALRTSLRLPLYLCFSTSLSSGSSQHPVIDAFYSRPIVSHFLAIVFCTNPKPVSSIIASLPHSISHPSPPVSPSISTAATNSSPCTSRSLTFSIPPTSTSQHHFSQITNIFLLFPSITPISISVGNRNRAQKESKCDG